MPYNIQSTISGICHCLYRPDALTLSRYPYFGAPPLAHTFHAYMNPYSYRHEVKCQKYSRLACGTLSAAANYVKLKHGDQSFVIGHCIIKNISKTRRAVFTCAAVDEVWEQKNAVEGKAKEKMEKAVDAVRSNFNSVKAGRATPSLLEHMEVDYYGTPVKLKDIAQISTPDAMSLMVQPYDKSSLKSIEKKINEYDADLSSKIDGEVIRLSVPQPSSEQRKELLKIVADLTEKGKVAVRIIRRDSLKAYQKFEKEKKLSKDNLKQMTDDIQRLTDSYIKKIDALYEQKKKDTLKL